MIYVCNLREVLLHAEDIKPSRIISMLGDDPFPDTPAWLPDDQHLKLNFHDIPTPEPGHIAPEDEHIDALLSFARAWERDAPLLVHCFAGVSRSTAAALIVLSLHNPGNEREAALHLRARAPHAMPNIRMIGIADRLMDCAGRLVEAVDAMGAGYYTGPAPLVPLPVDLT